MLASAGAMAAPAETLRHTPLHERHAAAGARLVPFAGWEMPVQYTGVREEHLAVRRDAGVFDVSHMGEIETRGPQALDFLQRILSNDVSKVAIGGANATDFTVTVQPPSPLLPRSAVPLEAVPMRLAMIDVPLAPPARAMPSVLLPEMTLPAPVPGIPVKPPMVLFVMLGVPATLMPVLLATAAVPAAFVPM